MSKRTAAFGLMVLFLGTVFVVPVDAASYTQSGGMVTQTGQAYTASGTNESGVLVTNSGVFTLSDSTVTTTGNTSSADNSSFYGQNAGVLANSGATINLNNCTVHTSGTGANGVFAYGTGTNVHMTGGSVTCLAQLGHAVMATGGGTLTATNVVMSTAGTNSGAIATDRGGGTVTVEGGSATTSGQDSPGIYSTGIITVHNCTISASASEGAVIEGLNTVTLVDTDLSGGKETYGGVMLMQSMSGDAEVGTANFIMTRGSLTATTGPLFFITNTQGNIELTGVDTSAASGVLISAAGTSRWGTTGSNGGIVTFTASEQTLTGNIEIDNISTLSATLENGSSWTGALDSANTAGSTTFTMDATSTWTVTADSHVGGLNNSSGVSGSTISNIIGNGHNVYYNASVGANSYLGGGVYSLVNGGYLLPEGSTPPETTQVTLTVEVEGNGTVQPAEGSHSYDAGSVVTLTATPAFCSQFVGWQGDVESADNPLSIALDADQTVTAVFEQVENAPAASGITCLILAELIIVAYLLAKMWRVEKQ